MLAVEPPLWQLLLHSLISIFHLTRRSPLCFFEDQDQCHLRISKQEVQLPALERHLLALSCRVFFLRCREVAFLFLGSSVSQIMREFGCPRNLEGADMCTFCLVVPEYLSIFFSHIIVAKL